MPKKSKQPRAGRPLEPSKPKKRSFLLSLPADLADAVDVLSAEQGRPAYFEHVLLEREDIQAQLQRQQEQKKP